jgi:3',5'-cyclic AMP phosphodiesterase CpdA
MAFFRIAQISDLHITQAMGPYGVDTAAHLARALAAIGGLGVDAIIATGDLVQDGAPAEYARLRACLAAAAAPVFLLPGNHDDRQCLRSVFSDHAYWPDTDDLSYVIEDYPLRIVMFDDAWPGEIGGRMTAERAAWLDRALACAPHRPTLLALHHPPFATGDIGFDQIGLADAGLLADVLAKHTQVRRIVCGHFHRASIGEIAGRCAIICPSTGWHYRLALQEGQSHTPPTTEPPGFLLHQLDAAGAISSVSLWI